MFYVYVQYIYCREERIDEDKIDISNLRQRIAPVISLEIIDAQNTCYFVV